MQVVFIEGEEGIGKTTILAQLMERRPETVIRLFITPLSRMSYSKDYINLAITEQIYWLFEGKRFPSDHASSSDVLKTMLRLQKHAKSAPIIFVIDGLGEIDVADRQRVVDYLFEDVLPLGLREFRFVISGEIDTLSLPEADKLLTQTQHVLPFDQPQIRKYFSEFELQESEIRDLKNFSHGLPYGLEIALRSMRTGLSLSQVITHRYAGANDFFEIDWKRLDGGSNESLKLLLGLLIFSSRSLSVDDLSKLTGMALGDVHDLLARTYFISVHENDRTIRFRSEPQRRFIAKKLEGLRIRAQNTLIEDFLLRPMDRDSLSFLPEQLTDAGRFEKIIETLDNEHFHRLLAEEKSISVLKNHATIGRETAEKLNNIANTFQFSMMGSVFIEIENSDSSRMMVQALLTLGKTEEAVTIAGQASTKEDRFALLACIGQHLVAEKLNLPSELKEQILEASKFVDFKNLGRKASVIANDLIGIDPDLAIEILHTSEKNKNDGKGRDFAFATLHAAMSTSNLTDEVRERAQKKARDRMTDSKIKEFVEAATAVFAKYSAIRIIEKIETLGFEHRMFFVGVWLENNPKNQDAAEVAEYALNLMVEQTEYLPKLSDFIPIVAILPNLTDRAKARSILETVESQKAVVAANGTSEFYVRLKMLFLLADAVDNIEKAVERAIEIFSVVDDMIDIGTKTTCFAWILHYMHDCQRRNFIDAETDLESASAMRLIECIEDLLASTVDHYSITRQAIRALARNYTDKAFSLARRLNTSASRNKAFRHLSRVILTDRSYVLGYGNVIDAVGSITTLIDKDHAGMDMLAKLRDNDDFDISRPRAHEIITFWRRLLGPDVRMLALASTYAMLAKNYPKIAGDLNLEKNLLPYWDEMPDGGYKLNVGFQIVEILAPHNVALAERWMNKLTDDYASQSLISLEIEPMIMTSITLAIRSFIGLVNAKAVEERVFNRLSSLIRRVPGTTEQIKLWIDLAVKCWAAGDKPRCEEITTQYIRPLIDTIPEDLGSWRSYLIAEAAPALYISAPNLAETYLTSLARDEQDLAREAICLTLHSQLSPYDPKPTSSVAEYKLDYPRALDIVSVMTKLKYDASLLSAIGTFCDCLLSSKNRNTFTVVQKKKFISELNRLVSTALPDVQNITHFGYQIAARARLLRVQSDFEKVDLQQWRDLKTLADDIPNKADRAFVICMIAVQAAPKEMAIAKVWLGEAKALTNEIPSLKDKIDRYRWMSEMVGKIDAGFCHLMLKEAFQLADSLEKKDDVEERQRRILDVAHQIDPKLADELVVLLDKDPARNRAEQLSHLKVLKSRKKLFDKSTKQKDELNLSDDELIEVAWGNFRSMLAGRYSARHLDDMEFLIQRASRIPLIRSFPIWSWFIENVNRRYQHSPKELSMLAAILDSSMSAAELACHLAGRTGAGVQSDATTSNLFRHGDRDAALLQLKEWVKEFVVDEVLISDPYFGPDEFEILKMIQEEKPAATIRLLLCEDYIKKYLGPGTHEELFRDRWGDISDEDPPRTDIVVVGVKPHGVHPIHDRWLVTQKGGIRIGTSIHSIGVGRTSEISKIAEDEVEARREEIESYLSRKRRFVGPNRVNYRVVDM